MAVIRLPASVSDTLLHAKDSDSTERVMLPITRYKNVLNGPSVVDNPYSVKGAPFLLYQVAEEELPLEEVRQLVSGLV